VSGRHQPENGADSPQSIAGYVNPDGSGEGNWAETLHPYRVYVEDEVGSRWWITVSAAIGKHDARNQAIDVGRSQGYYDVTALRIERIPSNHHD
jgi:hypothetical protein